MSKKGGIITQDKRPVYNGYEERYVTGAELKELFPGEYLSTKGRSPTVFGILISDYLCYLGIDDLKNYRVFINHAYCKIMKADTDGGVCFFGHTSLEYVKLSSKPEYRPENIHLGKNCPECGASLILKQGRYGPFLSCSAYPNCKHITNIPIIGHFNPSLEQMKTLYKITMKEYCKNGLQQDD